MISSLPPTTTAVPAPPVQAPAPEDAVPRLSRRIRAVRIAAIGVVLLILAAGVPAFDLAGWMPDEAVNTLGRYLCYAIAALGIDLIWGYCGILSLCQALFFAIGGYAIGMFLSLPQGGGQVQAVYHNIPQFFFFNDRTTLPAFWKPFASPVFAASAGLLIPAVFAAIFGYFIFRSRVRGVYFAIITQALAWAAYLAFCRNEMLLGGSNGLTNFYPPLNNSRHWILGLYLLTLAILILAYLLCMFMVRSKFGRVLVAVRDKELRLNFAGYRPYVFKMVAFAIAAALGALAGILYVPQNGIITPDMMRVPASIGMVIWVALGGRGRLWGAILGALVVRYAYSTVTTDIPMVWPFVQGGLFILVVLLFPDGLVGLWDKIEQSIQAHESALGLLLAVVPFLTITLFTLLEALSMMPSIMQHNIPVGLNTLPNIQLKYVVLTCLLVFGGFGRWLYNRHLARKFHSSLSTDPLVEVVTTGSIVTKEPS